MWYDQSEGLCFECTGCGACCRRPGEVYLTHEEVDALSAFLKLSVDHFEQTYLKLEPEGLWSIHIEPGKPCPFLDEQERCTVQPVKPWQCRAYPFWPEVVETAQSWEEEAACCEGIGRGKRHSPEDVAEIMSEDPFLQD